MARRYVMTAKRKAALRKAQLASARKRRRNRRIDRKISRVEKRTAKKIAKKSRKIQTGMYTHSTQGGVYMTMSAVKAYNKNIRTYNKGVKKTNKLRGKKR